MKGITLKSIILSVAVTWVVMSKSRRPRLDVAWVWPLVETPGVRTAVITQEFSAQHLGVDISVPGHYRDAVEYVRAVAPGRVTFAGHTPRGWQVVINHGAWDTAYLHLRAVTVNRGDLVEAGHGLGPMGADPLDAEGIVHLHLQLNVDGKPEDPAPYLRGV